MHQRFHVSSLTFVGEHLGNDEQRYTVVVSTEPRRLPETGKICENGAIGIRGDFFIRACGSFDTLDEARSHARMDVLEGDWRQVTDYGDQSGPYRDRFVVDAFGVGFEPPMTPQQTLEALGTPYFPGVTVRSTDEEIAVWARELAENAASHGLRQLDVQTIEQAARAFRDKKRGEISP